MVDGVVPGPHHRRLAFVRGRWWCRWCQGAGRGGGGDGLVVDVVDVVVPGPRHVCAREVGVVMVEVVVPRPYHL